MFSIIVPMDTNRLEQFASTKAAYDEMPQEKEFVVVTRTEDLEQILKSQDLDKDVRIIHYELKEGFNCSRALNLGVKASKYDTIIITSPEVKPTTDVLAQFSEEPGTNIVAQVFDQDEKGNLTSLVCGGYRDSSPAMYFLAQFNKADIETINGWDEEFLKGYAYEDNDFCERWNRAGLPFKVRDDICATHQYHPRGETIPDGLATNQQHYYDNTDAGVTYCKNGLNKVQ